MEPNFNYRSLLCVHLIIKLQHVKFKGVSFEDQTIDMGHPATIPAYVVRQLSCSLLHLEIPTSFSVDTGDILTLDSYLRWEILHRATHL